MFLGAPPMGQPMPSPWLQLLRKLGERRALGLRCVQSRTSTPCQPCQRAAFPRLARLCVVMSSHLRACRMRGTLVACR